MALDPVIAGEANKTALEFLTGYLIEKALAVDNIFVFLLVFTYFRVPQEYQKRLLMFGILFALFLRAGMIFVGVSEKGKNMISLTKDQVTFTHGTQTFINLEFSLKFLLQFAKVGLHSSGLELYMSPDTPMVLKYGMRNHTGGFIRFVIAPKIMDEWSAPDTNAVQHEDNSE
jgi:hypothetical protein